MIAVDQSSQVSELLRLVDDVRHARQGDCVRLLSSLTPRLQAARIAERQRDRHLARRFNVFKYLREDELGLSRVLADLLDPTGEHGQGTSFLEAMLEALPETRGQFGRLPSKPTHPIKVGTERWIPAGRRIDITVDIPSPTGQFCLAFENKPYASDQQGQLKAYLEYLGKKYGTRFLLVYLPPDDREPDALSLPPDDRERWKRHFRIMPYCGGEASLADWFATCRKACDADRVSWFLRDAESFCQKRFGESAMTTNPDTSFVRQHLSDNPSHMRAALAVHDAWRLVRAEVCERFLEHLRDTVEARMATVPSGIENGFRVRCRYGHKKNHSFLRITRDAWVRYHDIQPNRDGRSAIMLESGRRGPKGWYWGVHSPKANSQMTEAEKARRARLGTTLRHRGLSLTSDKSDRWVQWEYLSRYENWDSLVPELYEECEAAGGPITTFYVDGLLKIAAPAILAINEVEVADRADRDG